MKLRRIAFLLVLLFFATGRAADSAKVTVENYNKVVIGSTTEFVYDCLGKEAKALRVAG